MKKIKKTPPTRTVEQLLSEFGNRGRSADTNKEVRALTKEVLRLRSVLRTVHDMRANVSQVTVQVPRRHAGKQRPATAVAMASDWHVEERVDPRKVSGLNRYNPRIAEFRAGRFFAGIEHLISAYNRGAWDIRDLVLILNGDLISGYIHEELMVGNAMSPIKATLFVEQLISAGLAFLARALPQVKVHVVCQIGNHGRTTPKMMVSAAAEMSYEYLAYAHLAARHPECEWSLPEGRHSTFRTYGMVHHVHHGDTVKSMGGIGGILVPLNRAAIRWREKYHAHVSWVGHFHQYAHTPTVITNGSLIGYSSYADSLPGAAPEPPQQAFCLVDAKRGICQTTPIWVGDPSAEKTL